MRILVLAVIASAALATGCSNSCQELGDRLCDCRPSGTTRNSCTDSVKNDVQRLHPDSGDCSKFLDSCHSPRGYEFCDWIEGRCGKAACGMSEEILKTLQQTPDPTDPASMICPGGPAASSSSSSSSGGESSSSSSSSSGGESSSSSSSSSGGESSSSSSSSSGA